MATESSQKTAVRYPQIESAGGVGCDARIPESVPEASGLIKRICSVDVSEVFRHPEWFAIDGFQNPGEGDR